MQLQLGFKGFTEECQSYSSARIKLMIGKRAKNAIVLFTLITELK
jgi:hypothetical protein